jgi:hypothetical protein
LGEVAAVDQNILIGIVVVVITCALISIRRKKTKKVDLADEAITEGKYAKGRIIAVKSQSSFDRQRGRSDIRVYVEYAHPESGEVNTYPHRFSRNTKNVPTSITGEGAGVVDVGGILGKYSESKFYRAELESQGHSPSEIKQAVMERAMEQARGRSSDRIREADGAGYLPLKEPVEVDVYLHPEAPSGNGIHIVFRK